MVLFLKYLFFEEKSKKKKIKKQKKALMNCVSCTIILKGKQR